MSSELDSIAIIKVNRDMKGNVVGGKVCFFDKSGEEIVSLKVGPKLLENINLNRDVVELEFVEKLK